jgi:type I restriction enzyme S subunit
MRATQELNKTPPENWTLCNLEDALEVIRGISFKSSEKLTETSENTVACLRTANVQENVDWGDLWWVPESFVKRDEQFVIENDILMSNANSYELVGKVSLVRNPPTKSTLGAFITLLRARQDVDPKFCFYQLRSHRVVSEIRTRASTTTNISNVSTGKLKDIPLWIAPLDQQKRIVAKIEELFSHIDAGIDALKKAKQLLKQYRQSVLKAAVTGELTKEWREANQDKLEPASKLLERILKERRQKWEEQQLKEFKAKGKVPKDDKWQETYEEPGQPELHDLPILSSGWQYVRLNVLTEIQGGLTVDSKREKVGTLKIPYLRVANVQRGYLDLSEMKEIAVPEERIKGLLLQDGDILFNEGGDRDKLGRGWVWHNEVNPCTYQNHVFRARPYTKEIIPEFISMFGNTFGQDYFMKQGKQTTNLASINKTKLSAFPVPLCSRHEIDEVMAILDQKSIAIDRTATSIDAQLLKAEKNKQSILALAFSGKLVLEVSSETPQVTQAFPKSIEGISETDVHAGVIALVIKAHSTNEQRANTLGHVKCEKIAHLVEAHLGISLGRSPYKDAAGPNDYKHLHKVDSRGKKAGWFEAKKLADGRYEYIAKPGIEKIVEKLHDKLGSSYEKIERLIAMIVPMRTDQAEIVATLYAGWNNLLLDGRKPTDEEIIYESRENWHKDKLKIDRERFFKALRWMREKELTPSGQGRKVKKLTT